MNQTSADWPEYLRMRVDASALPSQVVIEGEWRLTVITPSLIRLEHGAFTDDATQIQKRSLLSHLV